MHWSTLYTDVETLRDRTKAVENKRQNATLYSSLNKRRTNLWQCGAPVTVDLNVTPVYPTSSSRQMRHVPYPVHIPDFDSETKGAVPPFSSLLSPAWDSYVIDGLHDRHETRLKRKRLTILTPDENHVHIQASRNQITCLHHGYSVVCHTGRPHAGARLRRGKPR